MLRGGATFRPAIYTPQWYAFHKRKPGYPFRLFICSDFSYVKNCLCGGWTLPLSRWVRCGPALGSPLRTYSAPESSSCREGSDFRHSDFSRVVVDLPEYVLHREFRGAQLYFFSLPQQTRGDHCFNRSREAAALVVGLRPDVLFLDCCIDRLARLVEAAQEVGRSVSGATSGCESLMRFQTDSLKRRFSLLTRIEGGKEKWKLLCVRRL